MTPGGKSGTTRDRRGAASIPRAAPPPPTKAQGGASGKGAARVAEPD